MRKCSMYLFSKLPFSSFYHIEFGFSTGAAGAERDIDGGLMYEGEDVVIEGLEIDILDSLEHSLCFFEDIPCVLQINLL